jgi:hypothetical protein
MRHARAILWSRQVCPRVELPAGVTAAATLRTSAEHQPPLGFITSQAQFPARTSAAIAAGTRLGPLRASSSISPTM